MSNRWGSNGNSDRLHFLGSKTTVDGDCSHEIKRHLLLGRKAMTFSIVIYWCETWTIKKAEWRRISVFERWCWRRLLRVPWTARRSNQSILKEISPEYSLEGLMLKLKLQYFGHLMQRTNSLEKTLMLGKVEGRRRRGGPENEMAGWHHWLNGHESEQAPGVGDGQGSLVCCSPWSHKEWDMTEQLNWIQSEESRKEKNKYCILSHI